MSLKRIFEKLVVPNTAETEIELNFVVVKIKHKVIRKGDKYRKLKQYNICQFLKTKPC